MHQSTASYRSNRYVSENRHNFNSATYPTPIQQQQIQDLQQKVDVILMHNNQLIQEKMQLARLLQLAEFKIAEARSTAAVSDSSEVFKLRRQLEIKSMQWERLNQQNIEQKHSIRQQFDDLNDVIKTLTVTQQRLSLQKQQLQLKLSNYQQLKQQQMNSLKQELQNQIYENSLKKQIQHKQELREKQHDFNKKMEKKNQQWQQEKAKIEEQKMNTIINMQDKMEKQKEQMKRDIQNHFNNIINKIQGEADQKCRKIRDQTQTYIRTIIEQQKQQQSNSEEELKRQIQSLRQSLEKRQEIITNLLKAETKPETISASYYDQAQQLRKRIKQLTQSFFKQAELLKVKMAVKHDVDIREMIRVYENKIDVLTYRIGILEDNNSKLRQKYEDQIRSKMKQRQKFQVEVSKLKNYIRKMKIQLESYGKQMRLNIQGIKDQANSFSMSIIGQLGQQKNKKNFYEEQIRKMREVIDLKDKEMEGLSQQCQQKLRYYQQKLKFAKQTIGDLTHQLEQKDQKFKQIFDTHKQTAKEELKKQKIFWQEVQQELKKQILDLRLLTDKLRQNLKTSQINKIATQKDLQRISQQLQSCKQHIQALKLQMQAMGTQNKQEERNALKKHYQRVIQQLQRDKEILKQANSAQNQQMAKLVSKYQVLEKSIERTISTMKKKTELEHRVIELGMDNNLVKNLTQIFKREENKQNK